VRRPQPKPSLKARALRYLSMREHSRLELGRKLSRYAEEGEDVNALLDFLEKNQWLSTERFSESLVHRRSARFGNSRIVAELQSHGVQGETLQDIKSGLNDSETARACEVWRRKFDAVATDPAERNKQMRFLMQRGFSQRAVRTALKGEDTDGEEQGQQGARGASFSRGSLGLGDDDMLAYVDLDSDADTGI
jgi:regulatory protein